MGGAKHSLTTRTLARQTKVPTEREKRRGSVGKSTTDLQRRSAEHNMSIESATGVEPPSSQRRTHHSTARGGHMEGGCQKVIHIHTTAKWCHHFQLYFFRGKQGSIAIHQAHLKKKTSMYTRVYKQLQHENTRDSFPPQVTRACNPRTVIRT